MRKINPVLVLIIPFFLVMTAARAQYSTGKQKLEAFRKQQVMLAQSPYKNLSWRLTGPDRTSGRSTDVIGITGQPDTMYAAFATGGLWKTTDGGNSWLPLFDEEATLSIGDIAMAPSDHRVLYVGTGEANIFRASLPGIGIYKTTDGGKTFAHAGLENSGTIARIIIHPLNPDIVYVAASGNEWTYNNDRGVYQTTNGGKTWKKILSEGDRSGCIDLVMDPSDPFTLYASMWNRIRRRWSDPVPEDGDHLYKSTDGGQTWKIIGKGLPDTRLTGRIGIAVAPSHPEILYAFVDDHNRKRDPLPGETDSYERKVQKVVIGGSVYRSMDKGETWEKRAEIHDFFKPFSGTYGWVFSQIRVDPLDENKLYVLGVSMGRSVDGGKTWERFRPSDRTSDYIHGDNHAMWIDETNPDRILLGNDGGVSLTLDGGKKWKNYFDKMPTTQFYTVSYDMQSPFNIYGAVQDEGTMTANVMNTYGRARDTTLRNWTYAPGGEGTQIRIDPEEPEIIYSSSYYGRLMKSDTRKPDSLRTEHIHAFDVGRIDSLRGQWLAATIISKYNRTVLYHGLQYVYKSEDAAENWRRISDDLSYNDKQTMGSYPYLIYYHTVTALAEGNKPGTIYAGTDDGRVWFSGDDGGGWKEITKGLPGNKHVIRITPSAFNPSRVYIALNDRRQDNHTAYIYVSEDYGKNWKRISRNLPASPVNVIIEDPDLLDVLYCGTDMGVYMSRDRGRSWICINGNLPAAVSVNDMFIHPRDKKMVLATYGRGVYVLDDLSTLR